MILCKCADFIDIIPVLFVVGMFFVILLLITASAGEDVHKSKPRLKQIVILSRHNVRSALTNNLETLPSKQSIIPNDYSGHLTSKGQNLEKYMGEYFAAYMKKEEFITHACLPELDVKIHANSSEVTLSSAKAFIEAAFDKCVYPIDYQVALQYFNMFNPIIRNASEELRSIATKEMTKKLSNYNFNESLELINMLVDFNSSDMCRNKNICQLEDKNHAIKFNYAKEPRIAGSIEIANEIVDTLIMSFYGSKPISVGRRWNEFEDNHWKTLLRVPIYTQDVTFKTPVVARHVASPMLKYMSSMFLNEMPKFALLVGYDSNINSLMGALGIKPYTLSDQYELTPVGGKVVFEKWHDEADNKNYLKVNYVYQTTEQIRKETKLTLENPPMIVPLEFEGYPVDSNGYILWLEFMKILLKGLK